ncbi:MAG: group 1 glycosyl transferase [Bacteroidetes bacterium]|nr:MAG: group 1 glycosyl transferase [Bacteroidota bacterium]
MYRILRIINRFNLGGPTYNVAYLGKYMPADFETMLVGGAKDETEDSSEFILENLGLKPVIIPEMRRAISPLSDRAAYRKIKKLIRDFRPHIVHTHASKAGAIGRLAAVSCNVPVIVHTFHGHVFHSYFGKATTTFYKNVERYLARRTDKIIAISARQKEELAAIHRICPAEKVEVIPLGFDLSRFMSGQEEKRRQFRNRWQVADDELALVIVGRMVPVKNHQLFIEALAKILPQTKKKIRAFIIGDGEMRQEIETRAQSLGLTGTTLTFTSWMKDVDVAYAGADIVALSSWNEGTPVSLIEAQAAGKPVVSTEVGGIADVVIPGKTALLSAAGDADAFAKSLLQMTDDDDLRKQFSELGQAHVKDRFHYTRLVSDMEKLYRDLLRGKGL